jgi:uncharacterized membrane protein YqjE
MARSGTARTGAPDATRDEQSLGDLVSRALKDVSQLVHYEIALAKKEFKVDVRRAGLGAAFAGLVLIVAYPLLLMLLFAEAYALMDAGAPGGRWGAFLWTALTVAVIALIAAIAGIAFFKKITGMKLTRKTVADDIGMLKHAAGGAESAIGTAATGTAAAGAAPAAVAAAASPAARGTGTGQPGTGGAGAPAAVSASS